MRRAGVVHGLGRLGVSNSIWDKRGPLGAGEWERVRMQPYLTERMLHQSPRCIARRDRGAAPRAARRSGYPRGLSGGAISQPARVLGAADAYQAMCDPRPHRAALAANDAAGAAARRGQSRTPRRRRGRGGARGGRPSRTAPTRTRRAHRPRGRRAPPVSRGLSSKEIATQLVISPKTARNHIEHIYVKIGASSRATASLFAMQHGLLPDEQPATDLTHPEDGAICPMLPMACTVTFDRRSKRDEARQP